MNGASYLKHLCDDLIPAAEAMYLNKDFTFVLDSAPSYRASHVQTFLKQKLSTDLLRTLITWLQPFRLRLLGPRSRESIQWLLLLSFRNDWWVEEKNLWRLGWVCKGSPPDPQSNETVSLLFGSCWHKRRRLNQSCFWIDINKQIYLLNTLWLFSFL